MTREICNRKRHSPRFRRAAWPVRDVLAPVVRGDARLYPDAARTYFHAVHDHAVRVVDQADATGDLADGALDGQPAVTANRQNEVFQPLPSIATVFLPISFITGFFGLNFSVLVRTIQSPLSFWALGIASETLAAGFLLVCFKRRGWS